MYDCSHYYSDLYYNCKYSYVRYFLNKLNRQFNKKFLLFSFVMLVIFVLLNIFLVNNISYHYTNLKQDQSMIVADAYSRSVEKVVVANEITDKLLDERIRVALFTLLASEQEINESMTNDINESLKRYADVLEMDEIYLYNQELQIIGSATLSYLGWQPYYDHPVMVFYNSDEPFLIEDIRKDSESDEYFKYGHIKLSDGKMIQLGVSAETINELISAIQIETVLRDIQLAKGVDHVYFIGEDLSVINVTTEYITPITKSDFTSFMSGQHVHTITLDNAERYIEVYTPIEGSSVLNSGLLVTRYSMSEVQSLTRSTFLTIAIPLLIIYTILTYLIFSRFQNSERLLELAYVDPVTTLHNRTYLKEQMLKNGFDNNSDKKALIFINCSNFKYINQTYGFHMGDEILFDIGQRLKAKDNLKNIFRFTADRFVVFNDKYESTKDLIDQINSINQVFSKPFSIKNATLNIQVQIGVVEIENDYASFDEVMKDANYALENIHATSSTNYVFFNDVMRGKISKNETILNELRQALNNNDHKSLFCHFQPVLSLKDNKIVKFEGLSRLTSKSLGNVTPNEFIPIAENNQLIIPLGFHVLEQACQFLQELSLNGFNDVKVAINVSAIEIFQSKYVERVLSVLNKFNINPSRLAIEITESILFSDFDAINRKLRQLQAYGITVALDDFGTGFSSFDRLDGLNIDILKIDKYFVDKITKRRKNEVIVSDIISMAHKFGLRVIAEGVDDKAQQAYLKENKCDMIQGYHFSKPLSKSDAIILLKTWSKYNQQQPE